ncbi:MAG: hypothetical protein V4500_00195 [Pseudomonadota bacterium]
MPVDGGKKFGLNLWMKPNRHGSRRRRATATHAAVVESSAGLKVCSNESTSRVRSSRGKDVASVSGRQFYGADSRKNKHNLTPSLSTLHLMGAGAQQRIVEGLRAAVLSFLALSTNAPESGEMAGSRKRYVHDNACAMTLR